MVFKSTSTKTGVNPVLIIEDTSDTQPMGGTIISPRWPLVSLTIDVVI